MHPQQKFDIVYIANGEHHRCSQTFDSRAEALDMLLTFRIKHFRAWIEPIREHKDRGYAGSAR